MKIYSVDTNRRCKFHVNVICGTTLAFVLLTRLLITNPTPNTEEAQSDLRLILTAMATDGLGVGSLMSMLFVGLFQNAK